jgi:hypothetical protein
MITDFQPGYPFAERNDFAGIFMPEDGSRLPVTACFRHVQIGAANAAAADLQNNLAIARFRIGNADEFEWRTKCFETCCSHRYLLLMISVRPGFGLSINHSVRFNFG